MDLDVEPRPANDISRHDVIKDITRVEALLEAGYAAEGYLVVLSNDRTYWQPSARPDTIDAAPRSPQRARCGMRVRTLVTPLVFADTPSNGYSADPRSAGIHRTCPEASIHPTDLAAWPQYST